jgi:hypothetical protein
MSRDQNRMPDVPIPDFLGAICEIWFTVNYVAYHLAYTRVYLQTRSMQTPVDELLRDEQANRDMGQIDLMICRSHLAAFFWELHHVFEALEVAIRRGKNEYPNERYFYSQERQLETIRQSSIPKEIEAYRNEGHNIPAIIGQKWEEKGGKFLHHFLPSIQGHEPKESVELNDQLQLYFEYAVNVWLSFVPVPYKSKFPRNFSFPVTVPFFYLRDLPPELGEVRQLQISLEAYERPTSPDSPGDTQPHDAAPEA